MSQLLTSTFNEFNVILSVFSLLTQNVSGGAIYLNRKHQPLTVSNCLFNECYVPTESDDQKGGAICYMSLGSIKVTKTCFMGNGAYRSSSLYAETNKNNKSDLSFISVHKDGVSHPFSYQSIFVIYGDIYSSNYNGTNNKAGFTTIYGIREYNNAESSYMTFVNNTSDSVFCYWVPITSSSLEKSIFMGTKNSLNIFGVIHYSFSDKKILNVNDCSFFNNEGDLFNADEPGVLRLVECKMDVYSDKGDANIPETVNIKTGLSLEYPELSSVCNEINKKEFYNEICYTRPGKMSYWANILMFSSIFIMIKL